MQTDVSDAWMEPQQVLLVQLRVDLGVIPEVQNWNLTTSESLAS